MKKKKKKIQNITSDILLIKIPENTFQMKNMQIQIMICPIMKIVQAISVMVGVSINIIFKDKDIIQKRPT
jgi:hypothetical protein